MESKKVYMNRWTLKFDSPVNEIEWTNSRMDQTKYVILGALIVKWINTIWLATLPQKN